MIASMLVLSRQDIQTQRITDDYSIHRVVYDLFDDVRDGDAETGSGILYVDKGGDLRARKVLILSNRQPRVRHYGAIESKAINDDFLGFTDYRFQVIVNPTKRDNRSGKRVAVRTSDAIKAWFIERSEAQWGFKVHPEHFQIDQTGVTQFKKKGHPVTLNRARVSGLLTVTDRSQFSQAFKQGLGRGRAFGFGLLEILPISQN